MSNAPLVRLVGLNKGFVKGKETITIFDRLDLSIPSGDFAAVMGPSGSGKTTLLNLLGGIDRPDTGEIHVAGERVDRMSEGELAQFRSANIGFIFQFYNLMPMLTAEQNVELPLLLTKLGKQQRRQHVETTLKIVNFTQPLPIAYFNRVRSIEGCGRRRISTGSAATIRIRRTSWLSWPWTLRPICRSTTTRSRFRLTHGLPLCASARVPWWARPC